MEENPTKTGQKYKIENPYMKGPSLHYFSGMDRYKDFLLLKIRLITNRLHLPVTA